MKREIVLFILLFFLISCSTKNGEEGNFFNEKKNKEALYGKAIVELKENATDLDRRYNTLEKQIYNILEGDEIMSIAQFTRIKIELDFLDIQEYDKEKISILSNKFKKAFSVAEKLAEEEEDYQGSSLNDRFLLVSRQIDQFSTKEMKLSEYLNLEKNLNKLEQQEYPSKKILEERKRLLKLVLLELESALTDFEIPEFEETTEELIDVSKILQKNDNEVPKKVINEDSHKVVFLVDGGFDSKVKILNVGDTIEWVNSRDGRYKIGMVLGNGICRHVKSKVIQPGETYKTTFTNAGNCYVSDGIFTTQVIKIMVR
jgi:plastocyanin